MLAASIECGVPITTSEHGAALAKARLAGMTPQQRKNLASRAHLASCAAAVCERGDELPLAWRVRLMALVASWRDETGDAMPDP